MSIKVNENCSKLIKMDKLDKILNDKFEKRVIETKAKKSAAAEEIRLVLIIFWGIMAVF